MEIQNKIPPPNYLTGYAVEVWEETVSFLIREGRWKKVSESQIAQYCFNCAVVKNIIEELGDSSRYMVKGQQGNMTKNPLFMALHQANIRIEGFAKEYGITPSSRVKIGIKEGERGPTRKRVPMAR